MAAIKEILQRKSHSFLVDELLKAYWKQLDLLKYNPIWDECEKLIKMKKMYYHNLLTPEQLAHIIVNGGPFSRQVFMDYTKTPEQLADWPEPPDSEEILLQRSSTTEIWHGRLIEFFKKHNRDGSIGN